MTHVTCDACNVQQLASRQAASVALYAGALPGVEVAATISEPQAAGAAVQPPQQKKEKRKKKDRGKGTAGEKRASESSLTGDEDSKKMKKRQKQCADSTEAAAKDASPTATNAQPHALDHAPNTHGVEAGQL